MRRHRAPATALALIVSLQWVIHSSMAQAAQGANGTALLAWGWTGFASTPSIPAGTSVSALAAGAAYDVVAFADGTVVSGGASGYGSVPSPPAGTHYVDIALSGVAFGGYDTAPLFGVALASNGSLAQWGQIDSTLYPLPAIPAGRTVTKIDVGTDFAVALFDNGTAVTWGPGAATVQPSALPTGVRYTDISAGSSFAVAVRSDGRAVGWSNYYGAGSPPVPPAGTKFVKVAAGNAHAIGLLDNGTVLGWGYAGDGAASPPLPPLGTRFVDIDAGAYFSTALTSSGEFRGWGANYCQSTTGPTVPGNSQLSKVVAGRCSGLALTVPRSAPSVIGAIAHAWGNNGSSQLGLDGTVNRNQPTSLGWPDEWRLVSAGFRHSCGIKTDGSLWCWGANDAGQLGVGSTDAATTPRRVGTAVDWDHVSAGDGHTCALKVDASLWCWGSNARGQIGDASLTDRLTPVAVGAATLWHTVSAGHIHTCAISKAGTLWCWGDNGWGELGLGDQWNRSSPTQVGTYAAWESVSSNWVYTCATRVDGTLWCWGFNGAGQLGDGTTVTRFQPKQVGSSAAWMSVSAGTYHTCGLQSDGSAWCWGDNSKGALGQGNQVHQLSPVRVGASADWSHISAGDFFTCGLRRDGTLWCWGSNEFGQIGDGSSDSRLIETRVGTSDRWRQISVHHRHAIALLAPPQSVALSVSETGSGSGTVVSLPTGVDCGSACVSNFDYGSSVTLTASADTFSEFAGWSGCTSVAGTSCTVLLTAPTVVSAEFVRIPAPTIASFNPASGLVGSSVVLSGANLAITSAVSFNGVSAAYTVDSPNQITATVPAGATSGTISVTTPGGTATSGSNFTVLFTPTVAGFSPGSGLVGASVAISGTNFTNVSAVKFNGTSALFNVDSSSQITATVPAGATSGTISVTTSGGTATSGSSFTVLFAPTVASFSPGSGLVGASVTISGTNFTNVSAVGFNGTSALFTVNSPNQITATVPAGATSGLISVTTPGGTATSGSSFTVLVAAPTITSFTPTSGGVGTAVTLAGTNFTGATSVRFNGTSAVYKVLSATQIVASVPTGATSGRITVTTPGGTATSATSYTASTKLVVPTVTAYTPAIMRPGGAIDVTLTGTNLGGVIAVSLNGTALSGIVVVSASSIRVTVPASGVSTGPIRVTTSGGTSTNTILFVINAAPTAIDAGASHTCAVLADGTARCWGLNSSSQLGDGTTTQRTTPVAVLTAAGTPLNGVTSLSAGATSTCAVLTSGAVRCWGLNRNGQLGIGTTTSLTYASTAVTGLTTATQVSVGTSHACARLSDGTARCWGLNTSGQLGDGTTTQRTLPVTVLSASAATLTGISQIEAGANHSCLLRGTGDTAAIRCVGSNANGQLGTAGTTSARFASTDATGGTGALTITAGSSFSMAIVPSASLSPTGAAACGINTNGQLGIGSTTQQTRFTMLMLL